MSEKEQGKHNKKGEGHMQTAVQKKITALSGRALQRRNSFPNQKNQQDVQIENTFFDEMKEQMYKQMTEDLTWNSKEEKSTT